MPTPEQVALFADLGGFALFLLVVALAGIGFLKGWVVPGWIFKQERAAREKAETQAARNAEAIEKLARSASREQRRNAPPAPRA